MKRFVLSFLVAIGAFLLAPQTTKAQSLDKGYEIVVVYNRADKTTTIILYKDGVEVDRVTKTAN